MASLPQNARYMFEYFRGQGLSPNAAAGICGNINQESGGNPESVGSGGNGLIGWTPPLAGAVTGHVMDDLQFQLEQVIFYINRNGSIGDINAHADSAWDAAVYFMNNYERPYVPTENLANRAGSAVLVLQASQSGNWKSTGPVYNPVPFAEVPGAQGSGDDNSGKIRQTGGWFRAAAGIFSGLANGLDRLW